MEECKRVEKGLTLHSAFSNVHNPSKTIVLICLRARCIWIHNGHTPYLLTEAAVDVFGCFSRYANIWDFSILTAAKLEITFSCTRCVPLLHYTATTQITTIRNGIKIWIVPVPPLSRTLPVSLVVSLPESFALITLLDNELHVNVNTFCLGSRH